MIFLNVQDHISHNLSKIRSKLKTLYKLYYIIIGGMHTNHYHYAHVCGQPCIIIELFN